MEKVSTTGLAFGLALEASKKGQCVAREVWREKKMFIYLSNGYSVPFKKVREERAMSRHEDVKFKSHIDMRLKDGSICIGWIPFQVDLLAEDWYIVE